MFTLVEYKKLTDDLKKQRTKDRRKLNKEQIFAIDTYLGNRYKNMDLYAK